MNRPELNAGEQDYKGEKFIWNNTILYRSTVLFCTVYISQHPLLRNMNNTAGDQTQ